VFALSRAAFALEHDAGSRERERAQQRYGREQFHGNRFYRVNELGLACISYYKSIRLTRYLLSLTLVCPLFAGQYAVLQNGFRIYADRHELTGEMVRLHTATGSMEIPKKDIVAFEDEEYVRPAAPPAPAPVPEVVAAPALTPASPKQIVSEAATAHGLRPEFVRSIAAVESAYKTAAVSPKGAIGLMQLMPGTAKELGVNPHVPEQNADGGTRYLKELLLKYANHPDGVRLAIAAYNAGPGAVDKYGRRIPPYRETQAYVDKVVKRYMAELKAAGQS
jgi:hypothetical protein